MGTHNWRQGDKVVWVDENDALFLGTIVEENWKEITVDFSDYPAYGLLDGRSETKVVRPHEIRRQGNEEEFLEQAKHSSLYVMKGIQETCQQNGCPLSSTQMLLIDNAVSHTLFNQLLQKAK